MTLLEKRHIDKMPTLGYWSALGGVEVKAIENGIEDYMVCVSNAWAGKRGYHRVKIQQTHAKDSRMYVKIDGRKLYLDDCLRSGI